MYAEQSGSASAIGQAAIDATRVNTETYLTLGSGAKFSLADSLSGWFVKACRAASLENRSAHGLRKAAGTLLARHGMSQYGVMTLLGQSVAKRSEIYTCEVEREAIALDIAKVLGTVEW